VGGITALWNRGSDRVIFDLSDQEPLEMSKITHHVISNLKGGWSVVKGGSDRATRTFGTQKEATSWGRALSKKQNSDLVIHKEDGTIADRITSKTDPYSHKAK
jgi:hypothetical protein